MSSFMWLCGRLIAPSRDLRSLRRISSSSLPCVCWSDGRGTGGGAEHPAEYPALFRREPRESSASFPPEKISLSLHHFSSTLIVFDQAVRTNCQTYQQRAARVPQASTTWIPRNLPRGDRRGGKHACHVLAQSADAINIFQLANDVWKRVCLANTLQVARMPVEPSECQELPRASNQAC